MSTPEQEKEIPDPSEVGRAIFDEPPLFLPVNAEQYTAFSTGQKQFDYRPYTVQWDESTCRIGRRVIIGELGKDSSLHGSIVAFHKSEQAAENNLDYLKTYGPGRSPVACIGIQLDKLTSE